MASQFPSNLDNGRKYNSSSDILFNDKIPSKFTRHHYLDYPHLQQQVRRHQPSSIDDLARHFTVLSLLQRLNLNPKPHAHIPNNFQCLNPAVRTGAVKPPLLPGYFCVDGNGGRERELELGQRLNEYGIGSFSSSWPKPVYDLQFTKPTPAQLESDLKERASRVLQGNQNMPFLGSGFGFKGGFVRESGGTGVFHPHPRINNSNTTTAKKQSVRERQVIQQRKSTKRPPVMGTSKQNHLPSDIRLPKEWTY